MIYKFDGYSLDSDRFELRRGADLVTVEPQVLDLLHYLICNRERVVSKDDLIAHVWNGRIVSDSTLSSRITVTRQAVGDNGDDQRLIRTVARKGLRFVGDVAEVAHHATAFGRKPATEGNGDFPMQPRLPDKPSIAVLPFTNMSGSAEQEYFSDGITDDIITALSRLRWFLVIARNSTFVYKGQGVDIRKVGRDLGVRYVLGGSVRKSRHRVRVTAHLTDTTNGNHIWAERYDRELSDVFAVQDEITASVTGAMEPKLLAAEGLRAESRSIQDLDAWDLVARAMSQFWKLTTGETATAIAILREALERHPNYGPAHSMLAFALLSSIYVGWIPGGAERDFAGELAERAIELDDSDPWAYLALGYFDFTGRKTAQAVQHFKVALDLNPNFAAAAGSMGFALSLDDQSKEAITFFDQAVRLSPRDPFNPFFFVGRSASHYLAAEYQEAIRWARQAVESRPGYLGGHRILCASLAQAGQEGEATVAMDVLRRLQPNLSISWIRQSVPYTAEPMEKFIDGMRKAGLTE